jgi:hypothetical protein
VNRDLPTRTGYETFTGAFHPVVFDPVRAAEHLPPWTSTLDGQCFTASEVIEDASGPSP